MAEKKKAAAKKTAEKTEKVPAPRVGDTVKVHYKIKEEEKERVQPFEGILIARKGSGNSRTITVRKIGAAGVGVERIFPVNSPNVKRIEVVKPGKTKRAKLYYLRNLATKL